MSSFWSGWIILLTVVTIIGTAWLLFANRSRPNDQETTGHVFDGIEEYDNPMPAWWFWMFVITIIFGIGYLVVYPGLGNYKGTLGWTEIGQYEAEVAKANSEYGPIYQKYAAMSLEDVAKDEKAMRMAGRLFSDNCAQCHGSDARGSRGYPNLADGDWIWGGGAGQIKTSINNGRQGTMPSWLPALKEQGVDEVSEYVLSLSGQPADSDMAAAGEKHFQTYCVACHGADGKGNPLMGAPNLTDDIWLYGGKRAQIRTSVNEGRNGVMPAQQERLYAEKIHLLAAYVYSLSN